MSLATKPGWVHIKNGKLKIENEKLKILTLHFSFEKPLNGSYLI